MPTGQDQIQQHQRRSSTPGKLSESSEVIVRHRRANTIESRRSFYDDVTGTTKSSSHRSSAKGLLARMKTLFHFSTPEADPFVSAYFIKDGEAHQVPHSGTLKLSHGAMRSIESQSFEQPWHRIFAFMNPDDLSALQTVIYEDGPEGSRKIVDLKKIQEKRGHFRRSGAYVHFAVIRDLPPEAPSLASRSRSPIRRDESHARDHMNRGRRRHLSTRTYPWIPLGPAIRQPSQPLSHVKDIRQIATSPINVAPEVRRSVVNTDQTQSNLANRQVPQPSGGPMTFVPPAPHPPQPPPPNRYVPAGPPPPPPSVFRGLQSPNIPFRRQQSMKIQDMSPSLVLTEDMCLKKLSTFKLFTIHRAPMKNDETQVEWEKAQVTEERLSQLDILAQMDKLYENSPPVPEKKAALSREQQSQVTAILDDLATQELDSNFHWVLAQLDTKAAVTSGKGLGRKAMGDDIVILVFAKRAPIPDVNAITLYQILDRMKAARLQGPPPPPQHPVQPTQPKSFPIMQQNQPPIRGVPKPKTVSMSTPLSSAFRKKGKDLDGDSSDMTDSDSDSSSLASSLSSTSMTTRPGKSHGRRKHGKGSRRRSKYRMLSPGRSRHDSRSQSGRSRSDPLDPITSAYQVGKQDVMADRFANSYRGQYLHRPDIVPPSRDLEIPRFGRYGSERQTTGQYGPVIPYDDPPTSLPRRHTAFDSSYNANDAIDRSRQTYPEYPRPDFTSDAEIMARPGNQFEIPSSQQSRFNYPQYYDSKPYDPKAMRERVERKDEDANDIVQRLLLEWTPQKADENQAEEFKSRPGDDSAGSRRQVTEPKGKEKESPSGQGTKHPVGEASGQSKPKSRQTAVDEVVDELDEERQSVLSVRSFSGSETGEKAEIPVDPSLISGPGFTTAINAITDCRRESSPTPISQPQPQPQRQPSWVGISWAQQVVETTAEKPTDSEPKSRFPTRSTFDPRHEVERRYDPSTSAGRPFSDNYAPAPRPNEFLDTDDRYVSEFAERKPMFASDYTRDSPFGSRDRYIPSYDPFAPRPHFAPLPGRGPSSSDSFDRGW